MSAKKMAIYWGLKFCQELIQGLYWLKIGADNIKVYSE
jgi:hypothetical protein